MSDITTARVRTLIHDSRTEDRIVETGYSTDLYTALLSHADDLSEAPDVVEFWGSGDTISPIDGSVESGAWRVHLLRVTE